MLLKGIEAFKVAAKSSNTNSFGLYQMIVISRQGEVFKTHASMYNVKEIGEVINMHFNLNDDTGEVSNRHFIGTEMTSKLPNAPQNVVDELFND